MEHKDPTKGANGWDAWGNHVLASLERIDDNLMSLTDTVRGIEVRMVDDLSALKVKSGIWGLVGGVATTLVAIGIYLLIRPR